MGRRRLSGALCLLALVGCDLSVPVLTYDRSSKESISSAVISADGTDRYTITRRDDSVEAAAVASNVAGNLRKVFWPSDGPDVADAQSCAVWASQIDGSRTQQGAALRITTLGGVTRALTVTKNIAYGFVWVFNLHAWDSSVTPQKSSIGQIDLSPVFAPNGTVVPLPWHLCARTLRGRLAFKAWPGTEPEPKWGDTTHGGSGPIPAGWEGPGRAGWYIGHLRPGETATFTNLRTWKFVDGSTTTKSPTTP